MYVLRPMLVSAGYATLILLAVSNVDASSKATSLSSYMNRIVHQKRAFLEIGSISLSDPNGNLVQDVAAAPSEESDGQFYVSFEHDMDTKTIKSEPLLKQTRPGTKLETSVALHLDLQGLNKHQPLKCDIYRKSDNFFRSDKKVGSAVFKPEELQVYSPGDDSEIEIKAKVKDTKGNALPVTLGAAVFKKQWLDPYIYQVKKKDRLEIFFALASALLKDAVKKTKNPDASELKIPVKAKDPNLKFTSFMNGKFQFPQEDEFESVKAKVKVIMKLLNKLPFEDTRTRFKNRAHGIYEIRKRFKTAIMPEPKEGRWQNPTSDDTMKRVFFSSMGMFFLKRNSGPEGGYVCDMSVLKKYKLRDDYADQDCITYFDDKGDITKIRDSDGTIYHPGDDYWEWAKLKARYVH